MRRAAGAILLILALIVVLGTCSFLWKVRPRSFTAENCHPVSAEIMRVSAPGNRHAVLILQHTGPRMVSRLEEEQYHFEGANLVTRFHKTVDDLNFDTYLIQYPHILRYRIITPCGSYAEGLAFLW
jgi:hypothetical protein